MVEGWEVAGEEEAQPSPSYHAAGGWKLQAYLSAEVGAPGGQAVWGSERLARAPASVCRRCCRYSLSVPCIARSPSLFHHAFGSLALCPSSGLWVSARRSPSSPLGVRGWFIWPVLVTALFLIISAIWAVLSRQASPQLNR